MLKNKYDWLKSKGSSIPGDRDLAIIAVPTEDELEIFVKDFILNVDRCLRLHSDYYVNGSPVTDLTELGRVKVMGMLFKLALKYCPWQFRTCVQQDKRFEIDWTEVDEWLDKYKES